MNLRLYECDICKKQFQYDSSFDILKIKSVHFNHQAGDYLHNIEIEDKDLCRDCQTKVFLYLKEMKNNNKVKKATSELFD